MKIIKNREEIRQDNRMSRILIYPIFLMKMGYNINFKLTIF